MDVTTSDDSGFAQKSTTVAENNSDDDMEIDSQVLI